MSMPITRVAAVGVGYSQVGRKLPLSDNELVRQAVTAAMADAGMSTDDIDGIGTMGGNAMSIGQLLGIMPLNYFFTSPGGPAFVEPAIASISAVAAGLCHTCVAIRLIRQQPGQADFLAGRVPRPQGITGDEQFSAPFGTGAAAATIAGWEMQRHMSEYGTTEEQFAINAVTQRYHASLNDDALLRDPLSVDDYLASRYISKPVRLLDCDYPVDSSSAVIFTTEERARDWQHKPAIVDADALTAIRDMNFSQFARFRPDRSSALRRPALVPHRSQTGRR